MIGFYGRSYPEFWTGATGRAMREHPPIVRDLAHFLYSAPNSVKYGLYQKGLDIIAIEFGRPVRAIIEAFGVLNLLGYATYDEGTGYVWVPRMAFYQLRPLPLKASDHNIKGARRWYANVGANPFLGDFWDTYAEDLRLADPTVFPGTEVTRREWHGDRRFILPKPPKVVEPEPQSESTAIATQRRRGDPVNIEDAFEVWWKHYPKKVGKLAARTIWLRLRPTVETPLETMIDVLEAQKRSHDWLKEGGQYIPDPERYLKKGKWGDVVTPGRAPMAKHNEGTLAALMELENDEQRATEDVEQSRTIDVPRRVGPGSDRDED